ncbi:hypothetical protein GR250_36920 [Rhizobium leguminosarum]|nr:hypothetical protein [Rhizobium leguminosarum]NKL60260.1 hypothetical protein [Rhizobium leguminosarum bv. viciae]
MMPFKHNAARSHRIGKMKFKVTNWPEYGKRYFRCALTASAPLNRPVLVGMAMSRCRQLNGWRIIRLR